MRAFPVDFFDLETTGNFLQKIRVWLRLAELSKIPSRISPREVHPGWEMARENHQNAAFCGVLPAWFSFSWVFWVLGGACQRNGVGEFSVQFIITSVLWRFLAFCDNQCSGRSGIVRSQALLGLVAGLLVRFWRGLWSWLAHVDSSRRGSRACFAHVAQSPFTGEWVPVSTTRWHAETPEGGSWTARAPLQRPSSRTPKGAVALRSQSDGSARAYKTGWLWPLRMAKRVSEGATRGGGKRRNTAAYGHWRFAGCVHNGRCGRHGRGRLGFLALVRSAARRLGGSAAWRVFSSLAQWQRPRKCICATARDRTTKLS